MCRLSFCPVFVCCRSVSVANLFFRQTTKRSFISFLFESSFYSNTFLTCVFNTERHTAFGQHVAPVYRLLHAHGTDLGAVWIPLPHAASLRHFRQQTGRRTQDVSLDSRQWCQVGKYSPSCARRLASLGKYSPCRLCPKASEPCKYSPCRLCPKASEPW